MKHLDIRKKLNDIVQEIFTDGCRFQEDGDDKRVRGTADGRVESILSLFRRLVKEAKPKKRKKEMCNVKGCTMCVDFTAISYNIALSDFESNLLKGLGEK